ncbi:hypothetical protein DLH72_02755 [Candidatus Gracilibacteria bacterium]|nr:MAG: hypothetical protein DLH72_02755 [Candidatus Gracilibacteria bacterium]
MKKTLFKILFAVFLFISFSSFSYADQTPAGAQNQAGGFQESCSGNSDCLASPNYMFQTGDLVPGGVFKGGTTKKRVEGGLLTIIYKIMVPLGAFALLIITIGAGYMILSNGNEEILNNGKKIFKIGIFAIVIALSSYLLVELLKYLLYAS